MEFTQDGSLFASVNEYVGGFDIGIEPIANTSLVNFRLQHFPNIA